MPFETAPMGAKRIAVIGGGISGMEPLMSYAILIKWCCLKPLQSSAATRARLWPARTVTYQLILGFWSSMT